MRGACFVIGVVLHYAKSIISFIVFAENRPRSRILNTLNFKEFVLLNSLFNFMAGIRSKELVYECSF